MFEFYVYALTAIPTAIGACFGYRFGLRRLVRFGVPLASAWALGGYSGWIAIDHEYYSPIGLLTPIAIAALVVIASWFLLVRLLPKRLEDETAHPRFDHTTGALLGSTVGVFVAASGWMLLLLLEGLIQPLPVPTPNRLARDGTPRPASWSHALIHTANRGFVRHLPLLGEVSDEVDAYVTIMQHPKHERDQLIDRHGFAQLADNELYQRIVSDRDLMDEFDAAADGDLVALYRIQKNQKVLELFGQDPVQRMVRGLRPSGLLRELEEIERNSKEP